MNFVSKDKKNTIMTNYDKLTPQDSIYPGLTKL